MSNQKLTQTAIKNGINQQIFSQITGSQRGQSQKNQQVSQSFSKSQAKANEHLQEVENTFKDDLNGNDDGSDINDLSFSSNVISKISGKARAHLKPSLYLHGGIAMSLNVFTVLTASPFNFFQKNFFMIYFIVSIISTLRYIMNYKSYTIFEYEDLYYYLKKKSNYQIQKLQDQKKKEPFAFYNKIINHLSESFPGVLFEYKMQKRIQDSEEYLKKQRESSQVMKKIRKFLKSLVRIVFNCHYFDHTADQFVQASDSKFIKYIKAKYWQGDEVFWTYFLFMNLPIVVTCYFGGFHIVFVDLLFIYFLSKIQELTRAQLNGDKLLSQTLQYIEKKSQHNSEQQRIKNGKIVQDYINLKHRQYIRRSRDVSSSNQANTSQLDRRQSQTSQDRTGNTHNRQKGSVPSQERDKIRYTR